MLKLILSFAIVFIALSTFAANQSLLDTNPYQKGMTQTEALQFALGSELTYIGHGVFPDSLNIVCVYKNKDVIVVSSPCNLNQNIEGSSATFVSVEILKPDAGRASLYIEGGKDVLKLTDKADMERVELTARPNQFEGDTKLDLSNNTYQVCQALHDAYNSDFETAAWCSDGGECSDFNFPGKGRLAKATQSYGASDRQNLLKLASILREKNSQVKLRTYSNSELFADDCERLKGN